MSDQEFTLNRRSTLGMALGCIGAALVPGVSAAQNVSDALDVAQGFTFDPTKQTAFGYIKSLSIGTNVFKPDLAGKDPTNAGAAMPAVAVLNSVSWPGGMSPIILSGQVSVLNRQLLASLSLTSTPSRKVVVDFVVYAYDPVRKTYYKSCYPASTLAAVLAGSAGKFNLSVASAPSPDIPKPINFALKIGMVAATNQTIVIDGIRKNWPAPPASA